MSDIVEADGVPRGGEFGRGFRQREHPAVAAEEPPLPHHEQGTGRGSPLAAAPAPPGHRSTQTTVRRKNQLSVRIISGIAPNSGLLLLLPCSVLSSPRSSALGTTRTPSAASARTPPRALPPMPQLRQPSAFDYVQLASARRAASSSGRSRGLESFPLPSPISLYPSPFASVAPFSPSRSPRSRFFALISPFAQLPILAAGSPFTVSSALRLSFHSFAFLSAVALSPALLSFLAPLRRFQ